MWENYSVQENRSNGNSSVIIWTMRITGIFNQWKKSMLGTSFNDVSPYNAVKLERLGTLERIIHRNPHFIE